MKISSWIKEQNDKFPKNKLRAIDCNDLLKITEFDNQPERSKRENVEYLPFVPCKHTIKYYSFDSSHETSDVIDKIEDNTKESLKSFIKTLKNGMELSYWDLSEKERNSVDEDWEKYSPMRCSEHCGNTMREVQ